MSDIVFQTATELARMIREREASASEILEAFLSRIGQKNHELNAIATLDEEGARKRAKEADASLKQGKLWGPLHGVPVTIKDVFETAGLLTTSSFKPLANYVPQQDATVVARLREAGAIIMGKTNMPMLATDGQSNSPIFGRANNPWNISCTPGGSTGGGSAALAAGLSPLEIGSDMGGSIRIPAHYCGLFGLKPTEYRISTAGHIPEPPKAPRGIRHMGTAGPVARSVEDLRLALSLLAGEDGRQWEVPPVPLKSSKMRPLKSYRFAWTDNFGGVPVTSETKAALENLTVSLEKAGCRIERQSPPAFDFDEAWQTWGEIFGSEMGAGVPAIPRFITAMYFRSMPDRSPIKRSLVRGMGLSMPRYARALTRRDILIQALETFLSGWDAWLCPVTVGPAFTHRKMGKRIEVDDQKVPYTIGLFAYTCVFNMTGNPVVVLPLPHEKDSMPIGVQVVGRRWGDMELLSVAEALTEVTGKFQQPPQN